MTLFDHAESSTPSPALAARHAVLAALGTGPDSGEVVGALLTAVAAATGARVAFLLGPTADGARLAALVPIVADGRIHDSGPSVTLWPGGPGLPQDALRARRVVVDAGPARPATPWGRMCAVLGIGAALAVPLHPGRRTPGVLVVGDTSAADAPDILQAIADDAATVFSLTRRLDDAADRSQRAAETAALSADLVAIVSHELRTPLTSIIGSLQTLQRPELGVAEPAAQDLVGRALVQTDRLRVLVDDLLVASRLDRHVLPVRMRPLDPVRLARDTIAMVEGAIDVITVRGPSRPLRAVLDADHLARILRNLAENVVRHAPGSSAEVVIEDDTGCLTVTVADRGPGISAELRDRLFDRSGTSTNTGGGLGLGLAIARGLAEAMGGTIRHEETPGGGATFRVDLPNHAEDLAIEA